MGPGAKKLPLLPLPSDNFTSFLDVPRETLRLVVAEASRDLKTKEVQRAVEVVGRGGFKVNGGLC